MKINRRTVEDLESNPKVEKVDLLYLEKGILIQLSKHGCVGKLKVPCVIPSICKGQPDVREVKAKQDFQGI